MQKLRYEVKCGHGKQHLLVPDCRYHKNQISKNFETCVLVAQVQDCVEIF